MKKVAKGKIGNNHRVPVHGTGPLLPLPSFHTRSENFSKNNPNNTSDHNLAYSLALNTVVSSTTLPSIKTPTYRRLKHRPTVKRYTKDGRFTGVSYTKLPTNSLVLLSLIKDNSLKLSYKKNITNPVIVFPFGVEE